MTKSVQKGTFEGISAPGPNGGCIRIPRYQRSFGWTNVEAHVLARDIHILSREENPPDDHWMGPVVIKNIESGPNRCPLGLSQEGQLTTTANHTCQEIIDGQQRLATLTLLWKAIQDHSDSPDFAGELSTENRALPLPDLSLQKSDESAYKRIFVELDEKKADFGNLRKGFDELRQLENNPGTTAATKAAYRNKKKEYEGKAKDHRDHIVLHGGLLADGSAFCRVYLYFRFLLWLGRKSFDELVPESIKPPNARKPVAEKPTAAKPTAAKPLENFLIKRFQAHLNTQRKKAGNQPFANIFNPRCTCPTEKSHKCSPDPDPAERVDLDALLKTTLRNLEYAVIRISEDEDGSKVYDTLNGRRLELDQYDHLKSYCFSCFTAKKADKLFETCWEPAEKTIDGIYEVKKNESIRDRFLYEHAISIGEAGATGFSMGRSFSVFRDYLQRDLPEPEDMEKWVKGFPDEAKLFAFVLKPTEELKVGRPEVKVTFDDLTRRAMVRLNLISSAGVVAVVSELVRRRIDWEKGDRVHGISEEGFRDCLGAIEGALYLRPLTGNSLTFVRPWVISLMPELRKSSRTAATSAEDHIIGEITKSKKLPSWNDLQKYLLDGIAGKDVYKGPYQILRPGGCLALLDAIGEELDPALSSPVVPMGPGGLAWSVDHVFPKVSTNWNLHTRQRKALTRRLEQIGNLAPLPGAANKSVGNKSFDGKTDHLKKTFPKGTTLGLFDCYNEDEWTHHKIEERSEQMANAIKTRWYPDPK